MKHRRHSAHRLLTPLLDRLMRLLCIATPCIGVLALPLPASASDATTALTGTVTESKAATEPSNDATALTQTATTNLPAANTSTATASTAPRMYVLLITGIGGEPFYTERFKTWTDSTFEVLNEALGVPDDHIVRLEPAPVVAERKASRDNVVAEIAKLAQRATPDDLIVLWYIGHATARGTHLALNLPGPDLQVEALASALEALSKQRVLVVLAAAATGAMLPVLSAPNRLIITATASAAELHAPLFAGPIAGAFANPAADTDKDRRVSVLEAFLHASVEVRASYKRDSLLVVEHALLDDNADGRGARAEQIIARRDDPGSELDDGALAARWFLDVEKVSREVDGDPERLQLRLAARSLVAQIEQLKREKQKYFADEYDQQLELLLVELALNRREYRQRIGAEKQP